MLPLFGTPACVYCGGPTDGSDHTPPRCLLPRPLPTDVQAMTVPACSRCNGGFSMDEVRVAAIVSIISFTAQDRVAVAPGGWVHSALRSDASLRDFVNSRLGADGIFRPDQLVRETISRIMAKTATGLLFHEFGRLVSPNQMSFVAVEHAHNIHPLALVEQQRRDDAGWAEVTASGRQLERQALALYGEVPHHMPAWRVYLPGYFDYMFIRRSNNKLLTAMKLHDALTVLAECPWPTRAGPRRKGRPPLPQSRPVRGLRGGGTMRL
jgi:hypothetical protein